MKTLTLQNIQEVVDNYPTKHKSGFTDTEINSLLKEYSVNSKKFYYNLGVNTVSIIDGKTVTYHTDIKRALRFVIKGSESVADFD